MAKADGLSAKARVRVAPHLPYSQDFAKVPDGAVPGGWVNTQGKFLVGTVDGEKVLKKVNDKGSPLVATGNAYIGMPNLKDYTIESDVRGGKVGDDLPEMGVVANRYTLELAGNMQKLRIYFLECVAPHRQDHQLSMATERLVSPQAHDGNQGRHGHRQGQMLETRRDRADRLDLASFRFEAQPRGKPGPLWLRAGHPQRGPRDRYFLTLMCASRRTSNKKKGGHRELGATGSLLPVFGSAILQAGSHGQASCPWHVLSYKFGNYGLLGI